MTIKSLHFRGAILKNTDTTTPFDEAAALTRIIIYLDKQCNGAAIVPSDLIDIPGGGFFHMDGYRNLSNSSRFQILMDKTWNMSNITAVGDGAVDTTPNMQKPWAFNKTCSIPIEYSGIAGALTEIRSNNIGWIAYTTPNAGPMQVRGNIRIRFSDS